MSQSEKGFFLGLPDSMLVPEFVRSVLLLQEARVTDCEAGSSVWVASSSVCFSEGLPCGMFVAEDTREVSWLLTRCSLTVGL